MQADIALESARESNPPVSHEPPSRVTASPRIHVDARPRVPSARDTGDSIARASSNHRAHTALHARAPVARPPPSDATTPNARSRSLANATERARDTHRVRKVTRSREVFVVLSARDRARTRRVVSWRVLACNTGSDARAGGHILVSGIGVDPFEDDVTRADIKKRASVFFLARDDRPRRRRARPRRRRRARARARRVAARASVAREPGASSSDARTRDDDAGHARRSYSRRRERLFFARAVAPSPRPRTRDATASRGDARDERAR